MITIVLCFTFLITLQLLLNHAERQGQRELMRKLLEEPTVEEEDFTTRISYRSDN